MVLGQGYWAPEEGYRFGPELDDILVHRSQSMRQVERLVRKVAGHPIPVLVQGETGTGKELVARAIHAEGERRQGPFVAVNCAAIPDTLIEAELFGHEKGAYTDAHQRRIGKFQQAHGGTIFLDEIGDMSSVAQAKILSVLQSREVTLIGARTPVRLDFRVISATNKDLERLVETRSFRGDLLFRLNPFPISIPPLRERREDIEPLALHFARQYSRESGMDVRLAPAAIDLLSLGSHDWPGNVRELQGVVMRAIVLSENGTVLPEHVIFRNPSESTPPQPLEGTRYATDGATLSSMLSPACLDKVLPISLFRLSSLPGAKSAAKIREEVEKGAVYSLKFGGVDYYPEEVLFLTAGNQSLLFDDRTTEAYAWISNELEHGKFNEIAREPCLITNFTEFQERGLGYGTSTSVRAAIKKCDAYTFTGARAKFFVIRERDRDEYVPHGSYRAELMEKLHAAIIEQYSALRAWRLRQEPLRLMSAGI